MNDSTSTPLWETLPSPLFALRGLKVTVDRETRTLWLEGTDKPLNRESAAIIECSFYNEPSDSQAYIVSVGSREHLDSTDALIKIVTEDDALATSFGGGSSESTTQ